MKIFVCSKKELRDQYYQNKKWFSDQNKYFISISGAIDHCEFPCPFLAEDSKRVVHLLFDDITEIEKDNPCVVLFDNEHANKIFEFIKTIPDNVYLYINCTAGISRSGAVGYVVNEYLNHNNKEDYDAFKINNPQIQPNPYVKRILSEIVFGKDDYSEIFKKELL